MEYNVCQDDIRKSEEKYVYNQEGLPVGEYSIFYSHKQSQNRKRCSI